MPSPFELTAVDPPTETDRRHALTAKAFVDGQAVSLRDMEETLAAVAASFDAGSGFTLYTLNLDHLVKRRQDAAFRGLYARATHVTADGWPVAVLARRADPGIAQTTGADLVVPLARLAARRGVPVYLFGSTTPVLAAAAAKLRAECPGLAIAGCAAPPLGFDPASGCGQAAASRIAASGARLCFVALGAPKQETFSDMAGAVGPGVGFVCIGAALDFLAGAQRRAPAPLQRLGLEWAWRLAREPRRLGIRYLRCAALFARLALRPGASGGPAA